MASNCTGPRTAEGKARSCMNALTHGLTAQTPLLASEDPEQFRAFVWDVVEDLSPIGAVQTELAHRAALLMWKRRRVAMAEEVLLEDMRQAIQYESDDQVAEMKEFARTKKDRQALKERREDEAAYGHIYTARQVMAEGLAGNEDADDGWGGSGGVSKHGGVLERLAKHERRIDGQIDSTLRLLLKLQNRRQQEQHPQQQQRQGEDPRERHGPEEPADELAGEPQIEAPHEPENEAAPDGPVAAGEGQAGPQSPPAAPMQNELPARGTGAEPAARPEPWAGPPGVN